MTCKAKFATQPLARAAAKTMVRLGHARHARAYYCKPCAAWHVTSMTREEFKEARR